MIVFRVDGNSNIGSGHVMRCLSIADAFKRIDRDSIFVLSDDNMMGLIADRGYKTLILNVCYSDMENEGTEGLLEKICPEMIIVDSYYVTEVYLRNLKKVSRLVYIDDLASFPYPVDILVNYNIFGTMVDYNGLYEISDLKPEMILGLDYVPLRDMFRGIPVLNMNREVTNVLVSTGGADPVHLALKMVKLLLATDCPKDLKFHFLIGTLNRDKEIIEIFTDKTENIMVHSNVKDMKSLIMSCDIVVSASGSTMYEVCSCGIPIITYVLADNQLQSAEAFSNMGIAINCGDIREMDSPEALLLEAVFNLADDYEHRIVMSEKMKRLVDGFGADRLVKKLLDFCNKPC